jgi:hypothetical protein
MVGARLVGGLLDGGMVGRVYGECDCLAAGIFDDLGNFRAPEALRSRHCAIEWPTAAAR